MTRYVFPPQPVWMKADTTTLVSGVAKPILALATDFTFAVYSDRTSGTDYSADLVALDGVTPVTSTTDAGGSTGWLRGPDEVRVLYLDTGTGIRWPIYAHDELTALLDSAGVSLDVEQTWTASQHFTALTVPSGALPIDAVNDLENQLAAAAAEGELAQQQILGVVRSVNGVDPDVDGNVVVSGGGAGTVNSVNGVDPDVSGDVTLAKADIGLGNVDNTSDANKPISTATLAGLAGRLADVELTTAEAQSATSAVRKAASGRRLFDAYIANLIATGPDYVVRYTGSAWPALSTVHATYLASGRAIVWDSSLNTGVTQPPEMRTNDIWRERI